MNQKAMKALQQRIGYAFHQEALLREALTHPSMGKKAPDNQRMEFLGDAILQYIISETLYHNDPHQREGALTHQRKMLVCEAALSMVARNIHLGEALYMDQGEEQTGGREKPSVLCDAMEALLAAVYLDGGMEEARQLVHRIWPSVEALELPLQDSKGKLQELLQQDGSPAPTYQLIRREGPDHAPRFTMEVRKDNTPLGTGTGPSKKQAEQAAAIHALEKLQRKKEDSTP